MASDASSGPIGLLGSIELAEFREYLFPGVLNESLPAIRGGIPVNLLGKELLRRGRRLVIFSLHPLVERETVLEGEHLRIYLGPLRGPIAVLDRFRQERQFLTRAINREQLTFLHAHWTYEYALAAADSKLPHVVTSHDAPLSCLRWNFTVRPVNDTIAKTARHNTFWIARTLIAFKAARGAHRLVAVSPYVADHLRRYAFSRDRLIEVIPNGLPAHYFARIEGKRPRGPVVFATALSHWSRLKNGTAAITAFAEVRRVLADAQLLMFGEGYGVDGPAAAWARKNSFEGGIEFKGPVPNAELIDQFSRRVDVLVHPSFAEAQPMPPIEAMSLGIPPIGGLGVGGVPWTLGEGKYGILVDVRSPEQIALAMLRLARDADARIQLGAAAREFAKERFHIEKVADRYEAIYAELAA
jgi:glycosyltransferase involved in cell wall biosynthesis